MRADDTSDGATSVARDTIVAVSTAPGKAAVAVLRLSGPQAGAALDAIAGGRPAPRVAAYRALRSPSAGELLDRGLALWFPGPASATGEDAAELHVHGGRAVVAAVLDAALALPGLRAAEPGEFARRAFLAGKLDLAEAEGLADLIDAETEAQRRQAARQSEGALSEVVDGWRERLVAAMALVEAGIDFVDEDDVPAAARQQAFEAVAELAETLRAALADTRAERLRDGFRVAIVGAPNAGKSSLLNALARREVAIVTDAPGTTRDVVEVRLDLGGYPVLVADTAGLRDAADAAEREGVRRALVRAREADLVLWLRDASVAVPEPAPETGGWLWRVASKIDLVAAPSDADHGVSTASGAGVDALIAAIAEAARDALGGTEHAGLTRARHREALRAALDELDAVLGSWPSLADELVAEGLRRAATDLGRIAGRVGVEDVLDRLFASFCIGK
ncbi:tRNA uridine-5-carboxymethylaminomethyl(34) synthesis GTPase MnmE [Methylopila turkensis]|nr:tRNA uridine-5-carboxymethylaminomethyl(34) synthesis GTPase MnmE [Methylopila turkensis]